MKRLQSFCSPWRLIPAVLVGCADSNLPTQNEEPRIVASVQAGTASILYSDTIDSLPTARPHGTGVRWGFNISPLQAPPYKTIPAADIVALATKLGASAVRFPVDLNRDGSLRNDDGSTYLPAAQVLQELHAAAAARGVLELPALLASPESGIMDAPTPADAEAFAEQAVGGFLDARNGWYSVVQIGNEYAGPNRGDVCEPNPSNSVCEKLVAAIRGGLRAARQRGVETLYGDGGDATWWLQRVVQSGAYNDATIAAWNFYAGSCGNFSSQCTDLEGASDIYQVPSRRKESLNTSITDFLNATGRSNHWYTEYSRDQTPIDASPIAVRELGIAQQVARIIRDIHGARSGFGFPGRAAFFYELLDRLNQTDPREVRRGAVRCASEGNALNCPGPHQLKPVGDSVRYWTTAVSDSARLGYVRLAILNAGRWSSNGSDYLNQQRSMTIGNGIGGLKSSVESWVVDDSVRGLFVQHAYSRTLGRTLDLSIVPNQAALAHWIGCLKGSSTCADGRSKSREWLLAELAASNEAWTNAFANSQSYATFLVRAALYPVALSASDSAALHGRIRNILAQGLPRWRAAQEAFWSMEYRRNETRQIFLRALGRLPSSSDESSSINPRGELIEASKFQERVLSDIVRSRSFVRASVVATMTPW